MNNRYTFKAKRKDGQWVYGNLLEPKRMCSFNRIDRNDKFCLIVESSFANGGWVTVGTKHWVLKETLCQCTGLKKFYEHDLVKYEDEDEIYEIVWFDDDCYFGLKGSGPRDSEMLYYKDIFKYLKLLGNKFDKDNEQDDKIN